MTNVPGPARQAEVLRLGAGAKHVLGAAVGRCGVGVSILSYGGGVRFGVITDRALCPEPQRIIDEFMPEFARLSVVTMMLPWGEST